MLDLGQSWPILEDVCLSLTNLQRRFFIDIRRSFAENLDRLLKVHIMRAGAHYMKLRNAVVHRDRVSIGDTPLEPISGLRQPSGFPPAGGLCSKSEQIRSESDGCAVTAGPSRALGVFLFKHKTRWVAFRADVRLV